MNKLSDNNDFIGLDISIHSGTDNHQDGDKRRPPGRHRNGRSSQTNSSIHKSRKRPRQQISQQSREENPKTSNKPKPPPAPPSSLVKLLQKDKSVLSYFLSLQENLEYDVDKWKREAKKWKNLAEQRGIGREAALSSEKVAETGSQTEGNGKSKNRKNAQSLLSKTSSTHEKISEPKKSTETNSQVIHGDIKNDDEGSTISITDDALFGGQESDENLSKLDLDVSDHCFRLSHDGDSDDEADKEKPESFVFSSKGQDSKQSDAEQQSLHNEKAEAQRRRQILDQLKEAKKCLDLLGVSLVEVEVTTTTVITPPSIYLPTATEAHVEARGSSDSADNSKGVVRKFMNDCDDENATFLLSKNAMDENMYRNSSTNAKNKIIFSNDEMAMPPTKTTTVEKILHRQSDEKVAAEMMASLKTLIKASSLIEFTAASHLHMDDIHKSDDGEEAPSKQENTDEALSQEDRMRRVRILRNYHPFCRDGKVHLPTVYFKEALLSGEESNNAIDSIDDEIESLPQHPASIGLQSILKILVIMDTYCRDDLFDDDWDKLFECPDDGLGPDDTRSYDEELMILQTGMRNRCRLANRISSSLDMEITRVWALTDRSSNLSTSSIHFHPADVFDPNDVTNTNGTHNGENKDDLPGSYSTKSFNRLVTLEERVAHARIATLLHRHDGDWQKAAEIVVGYIVSSAPTLKAENYPKLPPVLSLCILEALIAPEGYIPVNNIANEVKIQSTDPELGEFTEGWFYQQVVFLFDSILHDSEKSALQLMRALAFPVHVAGSIWKERSICIDDRIRDIAQVEVAAFERLKSTIDGAWLNLLQFDDTTEELIKAVGRNFLSASVSSVLPEKNERGTDPLIQMRQSPLVSGMTCLISLVTIGDIDEVISVCNKILLAIKGRKLDNGDEPHSNSCLFLLPACCYAYSNIICRTWETMKLGNTMGRHTASAFAIKDLFSPILNSITELIDSGDWENIDAIVQCCVLLGDGRSLLRFANSILPPAIKTLMRKNSETVSNRERNKISRIISVFVDAGEIPTVRVINLKRRPDRLLDFMSDAAKEQLIVIKGPAKLRTKSLLKKNRNATVSPSSVDVNEACSGFDAFDGLCGADELEDQLLNRLEGDGALSEFVRAKWRPGDLRAFDREARIGNELVATSITERACALSHIASWMGVEQSLSPLVDTGEVNGYEQKLIRMFKISGFARGPPLLHKNTDMEPVPVCVILEDDAVLGDRFTERLSSLLEELPRDFHFCSLGYSRPKTAPIVDFSSQLGIPSCLWYLTGYVLSLEGARYLIQSLPVTGPVDSWVGMKMCSNWDNVYGHWIGLGKHARATSKLPSKKDLSKIMKFRAFAALIPLCEQKVGKGGGDASVRVNWRDRDTDITYSG